MEETLRLESALTCSVPSCDRILLNDELSLDTLTLRDFRGSHMEVSRNRKRNRSEVQVRDLDWKEIISQHAGGQWSHREGKPTPPTPTGEGGSYQEERNKWGRGLLGVSVAKTSWWWWF